MSHVIPLPLLVLLLSPRLAVAQAFAWEGTLARVGQSLAGPVAITIGTIAIVFFGLTLAVSDGGAGMTWALRILVGLSIAFTAASLVVTLFR